MNRRVLIGIIIAIVGVGLIALGILAINSVLKRSFAPAPQATQVVETTTNIIVATHDMALGSVISREDVTLSAVPVSLVPRDALTSIEASLGKIAIVHLVQGEMVLQHHLADPTNIAHDIGYIIGPDQVLMAFPASDLMSGLGVLQRGDLVDIFASMTVEVSPTNITPGTVTTQEQERTISRMFTFDAMQRVEVTGIVVDVVNESNNATVLEGAQPTQAPTVIKVRAYLLALSAQDALVLKNMRDSGAVFDIVLRAPTSSELFEVNPVTEEYLIQRYELQIPR